MNKHIILPVPGFACEKLGSCYYILTNKKLKRLKTISSSWISKKREDTGQTTVPQIEDRQVNKGKHGSAQQTCEWKAEL